MKKNIIRTRNAPLPIGSYNQAVVVGQLVFTAGQIAIHPKTGKLINGSFKDRINQVFDNIEAILLEAGSDLSMVVKFTVFLTNLEFYPEVNEIFNLRLQEETAPARSLVVVAGLPAGTDIEIECVAAINE